MIEVMRIVDHDLVWLFGHDVIFPEAPLIFVYTRVVGRENIIAEEILFRTVCIEALRESHDIFRAFLLWIVCKLLKKMV